MSRVFRKVEEASLLSGRGSFLGPDTDRRTRWWDLKLECGHYEERTVKYRPNGRSYNRQRKTSDVLDAPKKALCHRCSKPERLWT